MSKKTVVSALLLAAGFISHPVLAETPAEILAGITIEAKASNSSFQGFSAARGEQFFKQKHGNDWSCSSCHTDNLTATGKHAKTGKAIQPFAPAANAERFTSLKKVAKWFKRNCNDVLDRVCTPQEQGDVLTYALSIKN